MEKLMQNANAMENVEKNHGKCANLPLYPCSPPCWTGNQCQIDVSEWSELVTVSLMYE